MIKHSAAYLVATSALGLFMAPSALSQEVSETDPSDLQSFSDSQSKLEKLEQLGDLRDRGIVSDEEFKSLKAEILSSEATDTGDTFKPEAFGIRMGQPLSDLSIIRELPHGRFKVVSPATVPNLDSLIVRATPETGVCTIEMLEETYENDRRGEAVLAAYGRHRQELNRLYGLPEEIDTLRAKSALDGPRDYAQSLWQAHRVKSSVWQIEEDNGIKVIYLDVRAAKPSDLFVKVSYVFSNYERCKSIIDARSS